MAVLEKMIRTHVAFNPADPQHRQAYWRLRTTGRQDPDLRFILEEDFHSLVTMMQCKLADHICRPAGTTPSVLQLRK